MFCWYYRNASLKTRANLSSALTKGLIIQHLAFQLRIEPPLRREQINTQKLKQKGLQTRSEELLLAHFQRLITQSKPSQGGVSSNASLGPVVCLAYKQA